MTIEAAPARRYGEEIPDLLGIGADAALADAETGVVELAAAAFANAAEHACGAVREVLLQPIGEELVERRGEAQHDPAGRCGPRSGVASENGRDLVVVEARDHRPDHDPD